MEKLFTTFSGKDIILFVILLFIAGKEFIQTAQIYKKYFDEKYDSEKRVERLEQEFNGRFDQIEKELERQDAADKELTDGLNAFCLSVQNQMLQHQQTLNKLIESDKDDIKGWLVQQYHYFVEEKGYIDDFSLDTIEKRFQHYTDEGGNSYIHTLMDEIRALPKKSNKI